MIEFNCPNKHCEIVDNLLSGKFLLYGDELFNILSDNLEYYHAFFTQTYKNLELIKTSENAYIKSEYSGEGFSKKLMIVLAVLSYEYNRLSKNIYDELIEYQTLEKTKELIKHSSYKDSCRNIDIEKLFKACEKRNIVITSKANSYKFTSALNVFLAQAKKIADIVE